MRTQKFVFDQFQSGSDYSASINQRLAGTIDALTLGYSTASAPNTAPTSNLSIPKTSLSPKGNGIPTVSKGNNSAPKAWGKDANTGILTYWPSISKYAAQYGLDPFLIAGIIQQESDWTPSMASPNKDKHTGRVKSIDYGLMQLNSLNDFYSSDLRWTDSSPNDNTNIANGCKELSECINVWTKRLGPSQASRNVEFGVISYNGGKGSKKPDAPFHKNPNGIWVANPNHVSIQYEKNVMWWTNWIKNNYNVNDLNYGVVKPLLTILGPL